MKKIIAMLMALVMMMSLVACGAGGEDVTFSRGVVEGNVYTSEFGGITFTAPEGYRFYSDEEIATVNGASEEMFDVETLDTVVYDMHCINETTGNSININFENIDNIYGMLLDEESYIELSMTTLETTFASAGLTVTSMEADVIDISGQEFNCVNIVIDMGGVPFYETIIVNEFDGYMMSCTAAAFDEAELENILAGLEIA